MQGFPDLGNFARYDGALATCDARAGRCMQFALRYEFETLRMTRKSFPSSCLSISADAPRSQRHNSHPRRPSKARPQLRSSRFSVVLDRPPRCHSCGRRALQRSSRIGDPISPTEPQLALLNGSAEQNGGPGSPSRAFDPTLHLLMFMTTMSKRTRHLFPPTRSIDRDREIATSRKVWLMWITFRTAEFTSSESHVRRDIEPA